MNIVFEGCCHGELDAIYSEIDKLNEKVDLVLIGGDFQAVRNEQDLNCMSVPVKYRRLADFHKYYSGEKKAPYLTVFIGGNHEASNHLEELPYGGWVAENIYYLGRCGVVRLDNMRIGGISGIYKPDDYDMERLETVPYDQSSIRSVYHIRKREVGLLKKLKNIDVMMSHDWPNGIVDYGDKKALLKIKKHLTQDVEHKVLGSQPAMELLRGLKPKWWLSAHLHVRFDALVKHKNEDEIDIDIDINEDDSSGNDATQFLALDKCLPKHKFIEVINLPIKRKRDEEEKDAKPPRLEYDVEWLAILRADKTGKRVDTELKHFAGMDLTIPHNFTHSTPTQQELESKPDYNQLKSVNPSGTRTRKTRPCVA